MISSSQRIYNRILLGYRFTSHLWLVLTFHGLPLRVYLVVYPVAVSLSYLDFLYR